MYDIEHIKKACFIGAGGVGISALAQLMHAHGVAVIGLNDEDSPKTLDPLRARGIEVVYEKNIQTLPEADLYVYSDAWLFRGPQWIVEARAKGVPVMSYFEALGIIAKKYKVIAVAGTHGKTTTTAMIAEILEDAGLDPTVIVGSIVKKFGTNFKAGAGEYLVVEADEYMKHLLHFTPEISVITNIEADHLDCYTDLADIENTFAMFLQQTSQAVICDPHDASVARVLAGQSLSVIDYQKVVPEVPPLVVPGMHNRLDAGCALAVADLLGVSRATALKSLSEFSGTWRRLENKGTTKNGTIIYDDYAHHPTEVRASLQALRELYPKGVKKITLLFQPHLYSRTKALFEDFVTAFTEADAVYFLPIYFAREAPDPSISSELLASRISGAQTFISLDAAQAFFLQHTPSDVFVTMGAGEAYKVGDALLK